MQTEYEATFTNVSKDQIRDLLSKAGAKLIKTEFLQKRVVFNLPSSHEIPGGWLRVRQEGENTTMSLKIVREGKIEDQKEIMLKIDNFENAVELLETIGCEKKAYQENLRERWLLDDVEVTIDVWPFLEPFVEVEGASEEKVRSVSEVLGFDYSKAIFSAVDYLYSQKYNISQERVNNQTPLITFEMNNPFV